MTLTLNIPSREARADAEYQAKLRRAADALRDADLITPKQAAELTGQKVVPQYIPDLMPIVPLKQGSPEWREALHQLGQYSRRTEPLSIEATSREYIYGDEYAVATG